MSATTQKTPRLRDARGRFIARPMFRIGEYRIGVDAADAVVTSAAPVVRRRPSSALRMLMVLVQFVVELFSLSSSRGFHKPRLVD